jgi:hypothetical protein
MTCFISVLTCVGGAGCCARAGAIAIALSAMIDNRS